MHRVVRIAFSLFAFSPLILGTAHNESAPLFLSHMHHALSVPEHSFFAIPSLPLARERVPLVRYGEKDLEKQIADDPNAETVIIVKDWFPTAHLRSLQKVAGKMLVIRVDPNEDVCILSAMGDKIIYARCSYELDFIRVEGFGGIRIWRKSMEIDLSGPNGRPFVRFQCSNSNQEQVFKMLDGLVRSIFGFDREEMKAIAAETMVLTKITSPDPEQCWFEIVRAYYALAASASKIPEPFPLSREARRQSSGHAFSPKKR